MDLPDIIGSRIKRKRRGKGEKRKKGRLKDLLLVQNCPSIYNSKDGIVPKVITDQVLEYKYMGLE